MAFLCSIACPAYPSKKNLLKDLCSRLTASLVYGNSAALCCCVCCQPTRVSARPASTWWRAFVVAANIWPCLEFSGGNGETWTSLTTARGGLQFSSRHQPPRRGWGGGGGFGMTPWCDDLVCSWRRLLADRHSLPFPWTLSLWVGGGGGGVENFLRLGGIFEFPISF